ncbi:hypothetical protein NXS19_002371 [Fusarium pseudograminearum]|nr:hypothetical protein NXS19_002371 [Fusarium pseudograminearum]
MAALPQPSGIAALNSQPAKRAIDESKSHTATPRSSTPPAQIAPVWNLDTASTTDQPGRRGTMEERAKALAEVTSTSKLSTVRCYANFNVHRGRALQVPVHIANGSG